MYIIFLWRTASLGTLEARTQKKWNAPHGNALHVFKTVAAGQGWKIRNREKKIKIHIVSLSIVLDFSSRPFPASISFWKKCKHAKINTR